jgi:hypothetical protein
MSANHNRLTRRERRRLEREQRGAAAKAAVPVEAVAREEIGEINHAGAPSVLRLVRSEPAGVPGELPPAGRAGAPGGPISERAGGRADDGETPRHDHVVAAASSRSPEVGEIDLPVGLVRRTFDAADVNPIINHDDVFRFVAIEGNKQGELDVAPLLADPRNVALVAQGAAILFVWHEPGAYEVHTNFLKPDRARQSTQGPINRNISLAAYQWMFTHTDCVVLLTKIPAHNRAAVIFSPLVGWVKEFERKNIWPTVDGELVGMVFCTIRYDDWVRKSPWLRKSGRWFHARLDEEFARKGRADIPHPDDEWHDLHVGAAVEMIRGGQEAKAVALYNRWARFAGYGLMNLVAVNPTVIDIGDALLQMVGDTFKVVLVR